MNKIIRKIHALIKRLFFLFKMRYAGIPNKSNYKIISLGLGIPSTTLYLQSSLGIIERADFAVFIDSGSESNATYKHLDWLLKWRGKHNGLPIVVIENKTLYENLILATYGKGIRSLTLPGFTKSFLKPRTRKSVVCMDKYKTEELSIAIRRIYGTEPGKKPPQTEIWFGTTLGDIERAQFATHSWQTYVYPFLNMRAKKKTFEKKNYSKILRQEECSKWLQENKIVIPPESGCLFCPFQSDSKWKQTKTINEIEWRRLLMLDKHLRRSKNPDVAKLYLHRSCVPLEKAMLDKNYPANFTNETSGMCGL